jgi:TRAP-type C4-dicarboxylate transport system permease small subunit
MSGALERGAVARALAVLHAVEDGFLAGLLLLMVVLAPLQIFLRNFFDTGITWADPLLRVLVLWVGLMGAVSASRGNRHITIDVLSRMLAPRAQAAVGVVTSAFAAVVAGVVGYYGLQFVKTEIEYESIAFAGVPAWTCEIIIPFAFGVIAIRYALYMLESASVALGFREPPLPPEAAPGGPTDAPGSAEARP